MSITELSFIVFGHQLPKGTMTHDLTTFCHVTSFCLNVCMFQPPPLPFPIPGGEDMGHWQLMPHHLLPEPHRDQSSGHWWPFAHLYSVDQSYGNAFWPKFESLTSQPPIPQEQGPRYPENHPGLTLWSPYPAIEWSIRDGVRGGTERLGVGVLARLGKHQVAFRVRQGQGVSYN
jgi:hypothetical protein